MRNSGYHASAWIQWNTKAKGQKDASHSGHGRVTRGVAVNKGGQNTRGRTSGSQKKEKGLQETLQALSDLAEWTGLEPATPGVTGRYSNQLNYHSW
jgi:hypothetical protein